MTTAITAALNELKARFAAISVANGYENDLDGRVYRHHYALFLPEDEENDELPDLPLIAMLSSTDGDEEEDVEANRPWQQYERVVIVEGWVEASENYEDDLTSVLSDIRRALVHPVGGLLLAGYVTQLNMGQAIFVEPDRYGRFAMVQLPLTLTYVEHYT